MIADYFIVRRAQLNLDDLYRAAAIYEYYGRGQLDAPWRSGRGHSRGAARLVVAAARLLYDYAWFVGFFVSGV